MAMHTDGYEESASIVCVAITTGSNSGHVGEIKSHPERNNADLSEIMVHAHREDEAGRGGLVRCCVGQSSSTLGVASRE